MVADATKYYVRDEHQKRDLKAIRCVVFTRYLPTDSEAAIECGFLVGKRGNLIQTLPLTRYMRSPASVLVGVYGTYLEPPEPAQHTALVQLAAALHSRAPRIMATGDLGWPKDLVLQLVNEVREMVGSNDPQPLSGYGIRIM